MSQIAQQDHLYVRGDQQYYKELKYPLNFNDEDECYKFLFYKFWKKGLFYDVVVHSITFVEGKKQSESYSMFTRVDVMFFYDEEEKIQELIFVASSEVEFRLSPSDIARYDAAMNYEQQIPNDAE